MKKISVVMPTYNRSETLAEVLQGLNKQTFKNFEVITVDDGSTAKEINQQIINKKYGFPVRYFFQTNKGPAAARNVGLENLSDDSDLVFFLGDDMIPSKDLLNQHSNYHDLFSEKNKAVLGLTLWDESVRDKFVDFLAPYGPQFNYTGLVDKSECDFRYLHTCNISFKAELIKNFRFDEDFKIAAFEDTELGYRIFKQTGLGIIFNPQAITYHKHKYNRKQFKNRQKKIAPWTKLAVLKHPELKEVIVKKPKKVALYLLAVVLSSPFYLVVRFLPKKFGERIYRVFNLAYFELLLYGYYLISPAPKDEYVYV